MPSASSLAPSRPRKSARPGPLTVEDFRYADQQGLALAALVLAVRVPDQAFERPELQEALRFKPGRAWRRIAHNCGTQTRWLHTTTLTPRLPASALAVVNDWAAKAPGSGAINLLHVLDYREALWAHLRAECNESFTDLGRHYLPIDVSFVRQVAADDLPKDLDDLIEWDSGLQRAARAHNRWSLAILA